MAPTILNILKECELRLAGVDSPRLSCEVLAAHVVGCSRLSLVIDRDRVLSDAQSSRLNSLIERRAQGEPLAYILGEKEFYGLDFRVTSDVLIPRPETEHIVEEVEKLFKADQAFCFADLGTGSGILPVTIATLFPRAEGVAVDISRAALDVARENASSHSVQKRLTFLEGDFTTKLFEDNSFDLIVSNPPYVTQAEFDAASAEVTAYEPTGALVSGADGLDHIHRLLPRVKNALTPGGYFLMEIGCGQGDALKKIIQEQFSELRPVRVIKDLAGHDRVVFAQRL